jgi:hypothetical protein|tara:strand:- start:360 stop:581 length:222 start_codon:yes stop_codon:yes gene_type:complete
MKVGTKIIDIRNMTNEELKNEGWDDYHSEQDDIKVLVFEDGTIIYPSIDYEGNNPGVFFGYQKVDGKIEHFSF